MRYATRRRSLGRMLAIALLLVISTPGPGAAGVGTGAPAQIRVQAEQAWLQAGLLGQEVAQIELGSGLPGRLYTALPNGDLFWSSDGGQSWSMRYDLNYADPGVLAVAPSDSDTLYASSVGAAYKSIDSGANWVRLNISDISAWAIHPSQPDTVYAGSRWIGGLYHSRNGGASWEVALDYNGANALAIDAAGGAVYAAFHNQSTGAPNPNDGLYRSLDDGLSWTRVFSSSLVNTLLVDPARPGVVYFGTEGEGIYRSEDFGASWQTLNNGLSALVVRDLLLDSREPPTLYAGTWEGGVFRSRDAGASWSAINAGLTNAYVLSLALDPVGQGTLYAGTRGGGVYRLALLPDPPPPTATYAHVVDSRGMPVEGALVYHNGKPLERAPGELASSDLLGNLVIPEAQPGDRLVALKLIHQQPTNRVAHDGWAYRVYQSSLEVGADGSLRGGTIIETPGAQDLVVRPGNALVLFNLVVSVEWDADAAYLAQIKRAVRAASDMLYDLSDGQLAFGAVQIYSSGQQWAAADIQIATNNIVRPHAFVGGISSDDLTHVIRVGRAWDGRSGNAGPWDQPDGFRTLAHEFGHYGLYLYDEYFGYRFNAAGALVGERPASCTGPVNRSAASEATNASVMDYQYTSSELSMRGVPGLWSELCALTAQFQLNEESAWETLARRYADPTAAARWSIRTPASRGGVVAGPRELPDGLLDLPAVAIAPGYSVTSVRRLRVIGQDGQAYRGAIVALYKADGRVIGQGFSDQAGQIEVFGADLGDLLRVASFDGGLSCRVTVAEAQEQTCALRPVGGATLSAQAAIPHLRLIADPGLSAERIDLLIGLQNFPPDSEPVAFIQAPGSDISRSPLLVYSPERGAFEARVSFSATERGSGQLWADRRAGGDRPVVQASYRLQRIDNRSGGEIFSNDGNLRLFLEPGSLGGTTSYLVVMAPGALPGPLDAGYALVGDPYDITASGAAVDLARPGVLNLHYDAALTGGQPPEALAIHRWEPNQRRWEALPGQLDQTQRIVSAPISLLGIYALLAPHGLPAADPTQVYLPMLAR